eukprot:2466030-Amphidinium_carterae.1
MLRHDPTSFHAHVANGVPHPGPSMVTLQCLILQGRHAHEASMWSYLVDGIPYPVVNLSGHVNIGHDAQRGLGERGQSTRFWWRWHTSEGALPITVAARRDRDHH